MTRPASEQPCPCGSGMIFGCCCAPLLAGQRPAPSALALMRSRYTAFVVADMGYLAATCADAAKAGFDARETARWNRGVRWTGLEILSAEDGVADHDAGEVEFAARFEKDGRSGVIHEKSRFARIGGSWFYLGGTAGRPADGRAKTVRTPPRPGRNDPCPCGSGKKYKRCCGA